MKSSIFTLFLIFPYFTLPISTLRKDSSPYSHPFPTDIRTVKIAIIDSGITQGGDVNATDIINFTDDHDYIDYIDHGTPIASIINGKECSGFNLNAQLYIIKAFNQTGGIHHNQLLPLNGY